MLIVACTAQDAPVLARMNAHLIQDEKAETDLTVAQLTQRMEGFLRAQYRAFFFVAEERTVGYALCDIERSPAYLRQFFIKREERRKGYGKQAFHMLLTHLGLQTIDLDVYCWNEAGIAFWQSLGFQGRYIAMRYRNERDNVVM